MTKSLKMDLSSVLTSFLILVSLTCAFKVVDWVWFKPKKLEKLLRKQGLNGNPYRLLVGDVKELVSVLKAEQTRTINFSDNLGSHILPYYKQTIEKFGQNSFVWLATSPTLMISDPRLIKEILSRPESFQKPVPDAIGETIAGGLLFHEGDKWTLHRKLISPAFHIEKLKNMTPEIQLSCSNMIDKWEILFSDDGKSCEVDVWPYLQDLSGDIISRTAFGTSHEHGRKIFELQKKQIELVFQLIPFYFIPGLRYISSRASRKMNAISKQIKFLLKDLINQRERAMTKGETISNDLLGMLMESNINEIQEHGSKSAGMSVEDVIEECKLFYLAGTETTSALLVWTMVLLSKHQDWQARAREEVLQVFGAKRPTFDGLNRLKVVTMILQEVMRLYPPVPLIMRGPIKTVKLGTLTIPAGVRTILLIGLLHHDPEIWGDDVGEFKPERFSEGTSKAAKAQSSFIPFSSGPRICIGQHFAMIEAKMALAMILQRFAFELSPTYLHAPFAILTLHPQYGAPLILTKL